MAEIPDVIRRAMEAAGTDVSAVAAAIEQGDPVPSDEEETAKLLGRIPEIAEPESVPSLPQAEQLALDAVGKFQREGQSSTSRLAAYEATPITGRARLAVLAVIVERGDVGATDEEVQDALSMNPSTVRPRRVELVEAGAVEDSGFRRLTQSGREAVVWFATAAGREAA